MKKRLFFLNLVLILMNSCGLFNGHNFGNDFKWKNKKLKNEIHVRVDFNPILIKDFDSVNHLTLKFHFEKSNLNLEDVLRKKLSKRNFLINDSETKNVLKIDTLLFKTTSEMVSVSSNDSQENLGYHKKDEVSIRIVWTLKIGDSINKTLVNNYEFKEEPRESFLISGLIVDSNSMLNLDKVLINLLNRVSYECYKVVEGK